METWYQTVFTETGRLPTQAESYAQGRKLGLGVAQVNQFLLGQSERSFGIAGQDVRQTLWRSFSTAQADLGFLRLNKKDYGLFLLGRVGGGGGGGCWLMAAGGGLCHLLDQNRCLPRAS